jgi:hypothetical protein
MLPQGVILHVDSTIGVLHDAERKVLKSKEHGRRVPCRGAACDRGQYTPTLHRLHLASCWPALRHPRTATYIVPRTAPPTLHHAPSHVVCSHATVRQGSRYAAIHVSGIRALANHCINLVTLQAPSFVQRVRL